MVRMHIQRGIQIEDVRIFKDKMVTNVRLLKLSSHHDEAKTCPRPTKKLPWQSLAYFVG